MDLFAHGAWETINRSDSSVMTYIKTFGTQKALILLNFSEDLQKTVGHIPQAFRNVPPTLVNLSRWTEDTLGAYVARLYIRNKT